MYALLGHAYVPRAGAAARSSDAAAADGGDGAVLVVKSKSESAVHRFALRLDAGEAGFEALRDRVRQLHFADRPVRFELKYRDADGDVCTISSDIELEEAIAGALQGAAASTSPTSVGLSARTQHSGASAGSSASAGAPRPCLQLLVFRLPDRHREAASPVTPVASPLRGSPALRYNLDGSHRVDPSALPSAGAPRRRLTEIQPAVPDRGRESPAGYAKVIMSPMTQGTPRWSRALTREEALASRHRRYLPLDEEEFRARQRDEQLDGPHEFSQLDYPRALPCSNMCNTYGPGWSLTHTACLGCGYCQTCCPGECARERRRLVPERPRKHCFPSDLTGSECRHCMKRDDLPIGASVVACKHCARCQYCQPDYCQQRWEDA